MFGTIILFVVGLVLLVGGAEALVRGAVRLAGAAGVSPLVIGLTVVAYGTSAPEFAVSVGAAWGGQANLAVGNVVGSNIFNILLILGVSAAITPLAVHSQLLRFDLWVMVGASAALYLVALGGHVTRLEGAVFVAAIVAYTFWSIRQSRRETAAVRQEFAQEFTAPARPGGVALAITLVLLGLVMLVFGARWLVCGATEIAGAVGVSELVIGLTVVAAGTSLPEVATSIVAALRGERDIAVGNVVGSNIANILMVLGGAALAGRDGVWVDAAALHFDLPVLLVTAAICVPIFYTGRRVDRREGLLLLGGYVAYLVTLFVRQVSVGA